MEADPAPAYQDKLRGLLLPVQRWVGCSRGPAPSQGLASFVPSHWAAEPGGPCGYRGGEEVETLGLVEVVKDEFHDKVSISYPEGQETFGMFCGKLCFLHVQVPQFVNRLLRVLWRESTEST
jgi:hypothetical protein